MTSRCGQPLPDYGMRIGRGKLPVGLVLLLLALVTGCDRGIGRQEDPPTREAACSQPSTRSAVPDRREIWVARARKAILGIGDPQGRHMAAVSTSYVLAEAGDYHQAKELIRQFVPQSGQETALAMIAGFQSSNGDLRGAIATADSISCPGRREFALRIIAIRQAQIGQTDQAMSLTRRIEKQGSVDSVLKWVVEAQLEAGDIPAAKATAAEIRTDYERKGALEAIARGKCYRRSLLEAVDSQFINEWLQALLLFSESGAWRDHALDAIIVARRKHTKELDGWIRKTLASVETAEEPVPATARLFLCVALVIADRPEEARAMVQRFRVAANGEVVGVAGDCGKPVLAYLFTKLGMDEELTKVLVTEPGRSGTFRALEASGVAEAEAKNWEGMEKRFETLSTPTARASFSCGVLAGLRNPVTP